MSAQIDIDTLIREGLQPSQLNDDAIARHLDRLYEAGIHSVISTCLIQTYQREKIPLEVFHGDTTSLSLYGNYDHPYPALNISKGYSRDRIGNKQIQLGLVGNEDGISLYGDVHNGNQSDKEWNPEVLRKFHEQFQ